MKDVMMPDRNNMDWKSKVITPEKILKRLRPGMRIFMSTGAAEPRTLLESLMSSREGNIQDLELIQVLSAGKALSLEQLSSRKFRFKTFYSGWAEDQAVVSGRVDLIPSRFSRIPHLITSGMVAIDVAFVQITPPNEAGYCSLGVAVDVARRAMNQASLVVGEINPHIPRTFGDTFVSVSDFDFFIESKHLPFCLDRWPVEPPFDRVAANIASVIEDGSCLPFSVGPFYEALGQQLMHKKNLGIHSPFFTDAVMALMRVGAVTNRNKSIFRGKSLTSYAAGSAELYAWLDQNPLVEFQELDKVWDPLQIGRNEKFIAAVPARKVDLHGRMALHFAHSIMASSPNDVVDVVNGAEMSPGGRIIFGLPSRNRDGESNIRISIQDMPNLFVLRESVDMVVTEYGIANLRGRTLRERAQALIDIAHPDHRFELVAQAKSANILYRDQIFIPDSAHVYPEDMTTEAILKGIRVRFRAIQPSDEEEMRRLFYRFSDEAVYYRYFSSIKVMPHARMQEYVNVDYRQTMSIVGVVGEPGHGRIIAEGRYVKDPQSAYADVAFVVDEAYQGLGLASCMMQILIKAARGRGLAGFTADVLSSNRAMMKVFEKAGPIQATLDTGVYHLVIPFSGETQGNDQPPRNNQDGLN